MIRRWSCYVLAAAAAAVFRVFYTGWLGGIVLWTVALLPLLGVITALPAVAGRRLRLVPEKKRVCRGEENLWRLEAKPLLGLPLGQVQLTVESVNELNGLTWRKTVKGFLSGDRGTLEIPAPTDHCGLVSGQIRSAWALDSLGLFWLPMPVGGISQFWTEPAPRKDLPLPPEEEKAGVRPRPGGGPGEDYDPRAYRPGDPLSSIHWKLSAKRDELVTRETLETVRAMPLLTFDCFGTAGELDETLELLAGVSDCLLRAHRSHAAAWAHPVTGELQCCRIADEAQRQQCLDRLLSHRLPVKGKSVLDLYRLGTSLHLKGGGEI